MKRTPIQVIMDAAKLIKKDLKSAWIAIVIIGVYFLGLHVWTYSSCPVVMFTGYPCPACGLTRAGIELLNGQFREAFEMNAFIYPLAVLVILFVITRYLLQRSIGYLKIYVIIMMVCMIIYYVYRMLTLFPGEPPMSYYQGNFLRILRNL